MLDEVLQQKKTVGWIPRRENFNTNESTHLSKKQRNKRKPEIMVEH